MTKTSAVKATPSCPTREREKIALLAQTVKAELLAETLQKVPVVLRYSVKTISKDLASGYDWIARTMFLNAIRIDDKFHVLKLGFEAMQAVRTRYRQEVLREEARKLEARKIREREARARAKQNGKKYQKQPAPARKPETYENGDTKRELLARSRYLLFKFKHQWTKGQTDRAQILYREFPEIAKAYRLMCKFRSFYQVDIGDVNKAKQRLRNWYYEVSTADIDEMNTFGLTVSHHEQTILNYFETGQTNAYAESLNSQIQRFIQTNSGTNDRDFFHFRLKHYFFIEESL